MAYKRKTRNLYVIQGDYGYGYGWEDVDAQETRKAARINLQAYRRDAPEYRYRLVTRRERIEE